MAHIKLNSLLRENMHRFKTKNLNEDGDQNNNGYPDQSESNTSNSKAFINALNVHRGDMYQSPWMWLSDFCDEYPELMQSTYFKKPIPYSHFEEDVKRLGCKFEDIAITGERLIEWGAIKKGTDITELERLAKQTGINYVVSGYGRNDCILWDAK